MQRTRMEVIFPIKDAASAALMAIKAECLHKAGIITKREERWVDARVRTFLNDAPAPRPLKGKVVPGARPANARPSAQRN
jgi:hypothetical protein